MDRRWIYCLGVTALVVFLGALLLRAPAAWILAGANRLLPAQIGWSGAEGTVSGMVIRGLAFRLPGGRRAYLSKVTLDPALLPLFGARLELDFRIDDGGKALSGSAGFGLRDWRLEEIDGELPLTALLPTFPELEIAGLDGGLTLRGETVSAEYGSLPDAGRLAVGFEDIRALWLQTDRPLGKYRLQLRALDQAGISGELTTLPGPALFTVTGSVMHEPSSQTLKFSGLGQLSPDAPVPLRRILPILGRAGQNRVTMEWQLTLD